jgi:hypothetical protein
VTAQLYDQAPPNGVEYTIAWLRPLMACDVHRPAGADLPYCMVNGVADAEDDNLFTDDQVVSVHTFAGTYTAANDAAAQTHRRMQLLVRNPGLDVTLTDSTIANADYVQTLMSPTWMDYGDNTINRFVARYRLGLSFVAVT